jgi:hypothetical protein
MKIDNLVSFDDDKRIENFKNEDVRDSCHYVCSSMNWMNIFMLLLLVVLCYAYFKYDIQ